MSDTTPASPHDRNARLPFPTALAQPCDSEPIPDLALRDRLLPFVGCNGARLFRGPAWVRDDGLPCVAIVSNDQRLVAQLRSTRQFGLMAWCWNNSPSAPLSLSVATKKAAATPAPRWFCPIQDKVGQAILQAARLLVTVACPSGQHCGWFEASFARGWTAPSYAGGSEALRHISTFPIPGIRYSQRGVRFDPRRRDDPNAREDEIPLCREPDSDFWAAIGDKSPWQTNLHTLILRFAPGDHSRSKRAKRPPVPFR